MIIKAKLGYLADLQVWELTLTKTGRTFIGMTRAKAIEACQAKLGDHHAIRLLS